jgi:integrase/recombinase XerD
MYWFKSIQPQGGPPKVQEFLSWDDVTLLISKCRSEKQRLFITFLAATGLRVGEMIRIKHKDMKVLKDCVSIRVVAEKTKEHIDVAVSKDIIRRVNEEFNGTTYLFETKNGKPYQRDYVSIQVTKIGKLIGKKISAHSLRHHYVNLLHDNGVPLGDISRSVGHKNPGGTYESYVHEVGRMITRWKRSLGGAHA